MQVQDTKLENPNLALLIDGETEIRIPMLANSTMSVTFIVVGYTN
jgi:hypothetical protein